MKPAFSQRIEKPIRKYSIILTLLTVAVVIFIHYRYPSICLVKEPDHLITVIGGIIAAFFAWLWKEREETRMTKEIFDDFNKRYDDDFNDVLNSLSRGKIPKSKEGKEIDKEEITNLIIDYFNMCSEEYLWYSKGLVPEDIWAAWRSGIVANINGVDEVWDVWKEEFKPESAKKDSYYGLYEDLKADIKLKPPSIDK